MYYGGNEPLVRVSFSHGTIAEASDDLTPGVLAFGYDEYTRAGAIYRAGNLVSSRVLDILLSRTGTDGVGLVNVKYVDLDGIVRTHTFNSVDEQKINDIETQIDAAANAYSGSGFVIISDEKQISINYEELYQSIKDDLAGEGIENIHEILDNLTNRLAAIEKGYVSDFEEEVVEGDDYTTVTFTKTSKESSTAEPETETVVLHTPNLDFYDKVNDAIDKFANIDSSIVERIEELEIIDSSVIERLDIIEYVVSEIDVNTHEWKNVRDLLENYS